MIKALIKKVMRSINFHYRVCINEKRISVPITGGVGFGNIRIPHHETWMNAVLRDFYKNKGLFVDVGINLGQTLIKFKSLHKNGRYLGFEPNPNCVAYCSRLIKLNDWKAVKIACLGLAERSSVLPMFFDNEDTTSTQCSATFVEGYRPSTNKQVGLYMPVLNLDNFASTLISEQVELIKIDVEGGELFVLEGMYRFIQDHRPRIIVEVLPASRENRALRKELNEKINALIKSLEYDIFGIGEGDNVYTLKYMNQIPVEKEELLNYNYLLAPSE